MNKFSQVCFLGLGYIGLPTASIVAREGIRVLGVDINKNIVDTINRGRIHIVESNLEEVVKTVVEQRLLKASMTPECSDVYLVVVPTPFKDDGHQPDISYVESATISIIPLLKEGDLYILESTSPVGTTEKMKDLIFSKRPELDGKIYIAYCPERVLPGNILYELVNNDRVIGGIDAVSAEKAATFYSTFVKGQLHKTDSKTAEMCKLTENSYRDIQIAFANELSMICEKAGIDVWELISLANKHPRVKILRPGCGVGGHCIAVDPYFLTADFPEEAQLIAKGRQVNNHKADWCIERIKSVIQQYELENKRMPLVAFMGLSFKPDIDDLRESPATHIVDAMVASMEESYLITEPYIEKYKDYELVEYEECYEKADIVVFLVAHSIFKNLPQSSGKVELDFCGIRNSYR